MSELPGMPRALVTSVAFQPCGPSARPLKTELADFAQVGYTMETLRRRVRQVKHDAGQRAGVITDERARLKVPVPSNSPRPG